MLISENSDCIEEKYYEEANGVRCRKCRAQTQMVPLLNQERVPDEPCCFSAGCAG